jgi:hypothetical protein
MLLTYLSTNQSMVRATLCTLGNLTLLWTRQLARVLGASEGLRGPPDTSPQHSQEPQWIHGSFVPLASRVVDIGAGGWSGTQPPQGGTILLCVRPGHQGETIGHNAALSAAAAEIAAVAAGCHHAADGLGGARGAGCCGRSILRGRQSFHRTKPNQDVGATEPTLGSAVSRGPAEDSSSPLVSGAIVTTDRCRRTKCRDDGSFAHGCGRSAASGGRALTSTASALARRTSRRSTSGGGGVEARQWQKFCCGIPFEAVASATSSNVVTNVVAPVVTVESVSDVTTSLPSVPVDGLSSPEIDEAELAWIEEEIHQAEEAELAAHAQEEEERRMAEERKQAAEATLQEEYQRLQSIQEQELASAEQENRRLAEIRQAEEAAHLQADVARAEQQWWEQEKNLLRPNEPLRFGPQKQQPTWVRKAAWWE